MSIIVKGYASTSDKDGQNHIVIPGAFDLSGPLPPLLYKHDPDRPAGKIITLEQRQEGLYCEAEVDLPEAKDATHFSVCFNVLASEYKDQYTANQRRMIYKAALTEVSLTDNPANDKCIIVERKDDLWGGYQRALNAHHDHLISRVNKLRELTQFLKG